MNLIAQSGLELRWLKKIDFFPPRPVRADGSITVGDSLCIATKSRSLGDALVLTTLPGRLKGQFPSLQIFTYPRAFNPIVFAGNPAVSGVQYLPDRVHGDDANWGEGHLIQQKESFFALEPSPAPKPALFIKEKELSRAAHFLESKTIPQNRGKPLCILHAWGSTQKRVAQVEFWDALVARWSLSFRFWQVGLIGDGAVQGCEYYFFLPPNPRHARKLFSIMSLAQAFVGVDSGPMHVARAFGLPSLILVSHLDAAEAFSKRQSAPYFLHQNWRASPLYEENTHLDPQRTSYHESKTQTDSFFEAVGKKFS